MSSRRDSLTCDLAAAALVALASAAPLAAQSQPARTAQPAPGVRQDGTRLDGPGTSASVNDAALADRRISAVNVRGLSRVSRQLIDNNLRVAGGQAFEAAAVRADVATLYRLGQFATVSAEATLRQDGTVEVTYTVVEQPIIREIGFVGNNIVSDQELRKSVTLFAGGPRDDFLLEQSVLRIKDLYRSRGNYLVEVTVDESRLADTGLLLLRIIEGPRVRIQEVEFVGNASFDADKLYSQIKTRTALPLFRKGELDEDRLYDDVAALDKFYKDMGFVDVRVDRRVQLSPDSKEAKVTFLVEEGRRYTLRKTIVKSALSADTPGGNALQVMSERQLQSLLVIRPGDFFTKLLLDKSVKEIKNSYLLMGYLDVDVQTAWVRVGEPAEVDLVLSIREGPRTVAGLVVVQGNFLTKDKVIRRLVRIPPGRPIDGREIEESAARLRRSQLFNDVRITAQRPRPGDEDPLGETAGLTEEELAAAEAAAGDPAAARRIERQVRDVLVEVKEKNTGSVNFGVGIGSDSGAFGEIAVTQRNFDIADPPLSFEEFISGRAFRGAGQNFALSIAPGTEVSTYSLSLSEPHLFESDIALSGRTFYRTRFYDTYDEEKFAITWSLARRLGDLWSVAANGGFHNVQLSGFEDDTPIEVIADEGPFNIVWGGFSVQRTDVEGGARPSRGTQLELAYSYFNDLESQESWNLLRLGGTAIFTVDEDYLGRKSTFRLNSDIGYIFGGDAPVFERFYLGGRSFRGFEFRTISPKSRGSRAAPTTPNKEPIGGQWLFFVGGQYEFPVVGDFLNGVLFMDTGTVTEDPGFDEYRASIGIGIRLYIPQLGPAPLAFDFATPLSRTGDDQSQVFSFSAELPF
jgi:outer membrane protein assembly factor BamA